MFAQHAMSVFKVNYVTALSLPSRCRLKFEAKVLGAEKNRALFAVRVFV
jgi:hypothetical protein